MWGSRYQRESTETPLFHYGNRMVSGLKAYAGDKNAQWDRPLGNRDMQRPEELYRDACTVYPLEWYRSIALQ
jgi:hypothetical protein